MSKELGYKAISIVWYVYTTFLSVRELKTNMGQTTFDMFMISLAVINLMLVLKWIFKDERCER